MGMLLRTRTPMSFQEEFNRLFNGVGSALTWPERTGWVPAMDVRETPDAYIIEADVPGLKKDEVQIEVADDVVTVKGERKTEREEDKGNYFVSERQVGSFSRSVAIPGGFQHDQVGAKFDNGVLSITLPKPEEKKPRKIEVKVD